MHGAIAGIKTRTFILLLLIVLSLSTVLLHEVGWLQNFLDANAVRVLFQSIVWEGIPFILLGAFVSSVVEWSVKPEYLVNLLSDTWLGRTTAGLLGLAVPVCDCGAVPVARTLRRKGVGESIAFTFVLSTPTLNLLALISTYIAFHQSIGWVFLRAGSALIVALVAGFLVRLREDSLTEVWVTSVSVEHKHDVRGFRLFRMITDHTTSEVFAIGPFFVASALLAAIAQGIWPIHFVTTFTQHSLWSIPLLMILGASLSLCSEADAFVAASLTSLFSPGAVLAFMLMGQTADIRNLLLLPRVFGKRTVIIGLIGASILIFIIAVMVNRVLPGGFV